MAFEQNYQAPIAQFNSNGHVSLKQKWKSIPATTSSSENGSDCFDCNICLDSAHDPVVTLCGHLYCWPCIYKWLNIQRSSTSDTHPKCPICKANISESSLVPLYGRGSSRSESDIKNPQLDLVVPCRPPAHRVYNANQRLHSYSFQTQPQPFQLQNSSQPYGSNTSMASSNIFSPTVGVFGEMVFARIFGSSETGLLPYPYSNTHTFVMGGSPRMRRQEMQLDKSLNRVSIFLFCCLILCLLLF
ncbi:hypothetical protein NMG60_11037085 [Bertholletia excelsa]